MKAIIAVEVSEQGRNSPFSGDVERELRRLIEQARLVYVDTSLDKTLVLEVRVTDYKETF